jgi:hypothetical protein
MDLARRMAADIGVDRLCWEVTDHPEDAFSRRFARGTPELGEILKETWDDNNLGNAIPGATPKARIDVKAILPGLPLIARAGRVFRVSARVNNLSSRPFPAAASYGRRLVRLGAQLRCGRGAHRPRLRARPVARLDRGRRRRRCPDRDPGCREAGTLQPQVRFGQRRCGLVRALRLPDDGQDPLGPVTCAIAQRTLML